jgi:hypothetical protein
MFAFDAIFRDHHIVHYIEHAHDHCPAPVNIDENMDMYVFAVVIRVRDLLDALPAPLLNAVDPTNALRTLNDLMIAIRIDNNAAVHYTVCDTLIVA